MHMSAARRGLALVACMYKKEYARSEGSILDSQWMQKMQKTCSKRRTRMQKNRRHGLLKFHIAWLHDEGVAALPVCLPLYDIK
jgi:hypothetical protein